MLPFLEPKHVVSVLIQRKGKPEVKGKPEQGGSPENEDLKSACESLLHAVQEKSPIQMAEAIRACFEICEAYPHEEAGEKEEEEGEK